MVMCGRGVARAEEAQSRDTLPGILLSMLSAPLTALTPALGYGHTHEEPAALAA
jgi:hypothetical protein